MEKVIAPFLYSDNLKGTSTMIILDGIIFSLQKFGGISTYFTQLSNSLLKSELNTELYLYNSKNELISNSLNIRKKRILERFRPVSLDKYNGQVLLHSSYYRYSKQKDVLNVITIYDFIYEKFEKNIFKKYLHVFQKKVAVLNSSAVICISESTKKDFLEYYPGYNPKNIYVTYLSHSNKSKETDEKFKFEAKFKNPYVLFVGMRSFHKNFDACVKALQNIDVEFKMIGGGKLSKSELLLLNKYIPGRYQHLTNLDNLEVENYYSRAICLLYPSIYEGFGLPILEAMANGCSVVTTNFSSLPEVAGDAAILLNNPSSELICESIYALMDPEFNKVLVYKGFRNIEKFSWDITINKIVEIYKEIMSK